MTNPDTPAIKGIHHIKLPVTNLHRSLEFYQQVFGAERIPQADHRREDDGALYAYICEVPGLGTKLELRLNPEHAERQRGFDFLTIAVSDRAVLELWRQRLNQLGLENSGEIVAIQAWLIAFDDPDGHRLRLYTLETHGPEEKPDEDNIWLRN